jgi:hypothetical protein
MKELRQSGARYDQPIIDYLKNENFDYFDMNEVQLRDFARYSIPFDDYMKLYFIGHYNPRGNHFSPTRSGTRLSPGWTRNLFRTEIGTTNRWIFRST